MPEPATALATRLANIMGARIPPVAAVGLGIVIGLGVECYWHSDLGYLAIPLLLLPLWWRRAGEHCVRPPS